MEHGFITPVFRGLLWVGLGKQEALGWGKLLGKFPGAELRDRALRPSPPCGALPCVTAPSHTLLLQGCSRICTEPQDATRALTGHGRARLAGPAGHSSTRARKAAGCAGWGRPRSRSHPPCPSARRAAAAGHGRSAPSRRHTAKPGKRILTASSGLKSIQWILPQEKRDVLFDWHLSRIFSAGRPQRCPSPLADPAPG